MRLSGRLANELRNISIDMDVSPYAEGSCLVCYGNTQVLCTASLDDTVPGFLRGKGKGWITAEYGMLPRSTHHRMKRESSTGKPSGRTQEIQRLISRSLRAVTELQLLGERQIIIDCDVLQADGGTRTASITGGYVALYRALTRLVRQGILHKIPLIGEVAAVSCGIVDGEVVVDLDYAEDSTAEVDANFVMTNAGHIIEVQGTAEKEPFTEHQFLQMLSMARQSIENLVAVQRKALRLE